MRFSTIRKSANSGIAIDKMCFTRSGKRVGFIFNLT